MIVYPPIQVLLNDIPNINSNMKLKFGTEEVSPDLFKVNSIYEIIFSFKYLLIRNDTLCKNHLIFTIKDIDIFKIKMAYLPEIRKLPPNKLGPLKEFIDIVQKFVDNNTDLILSNMHKVYDKSINEMKSRLKHNESNFDGFKKMYEKELILL